MSKPKKSQTSTPQSGPVSLLGKPLNKAQYLLAQYEPDLPEFPLDAEAITSKLRSCPGKMPKSLGDCLDLAYP